MLVLCALSVLALTPPQAPERSAGPLVVTAKIVAGALVAGEEAEFVVDFELDDTRTAPHMPFLLKSSPAPMIQIEVPGCVELLGQRVESLGEMIGAGFLQLPFEHVLLEPSTRIPFKLLNSPDPGAAFEFNILLYAGPPGGEVRLLRQRLRLPLAADAKAQQVDGRASAWGMEGLLEIGEIAPPFELARAFGPTLELNEHLDGGFVVVTTQRSCL